MADHKPVKIDPKSLEDAQTMWSNFTTASKYAACATAAILVLLALAFVDF